MKRNNRTARPLFLVFILLFIGGVVVIAAQAFDPSPPPPLPTLMPTAVAALPSATPTVIPSVSPTPETTATTPPTFTAVPQATERDPGTATPSPTIRPSATAFPSMTPSPTSKPQPVPEIQVTALGTVLPDAPNMPTAVPTAVPTFEVSDKTTVVMLLGGDLVANTDSIILVAINRDLESAAMVSLPRDLIVYVPGSIMKPINVIKDIEQLEEAILYNFGIAVNYYARVDFSGFQDIVDAIGGVDIAVTCAVRDIWELKSPGLDPTDIDNWEWNTLEPGIVEMDGSLALWYARSRRDSSDYERSRRQQQVLRAIFNQGVDLGVISQVPNLWGTYQDTIDTDLDIGKILQLAAVAPDVRDNGIQHIHLNTATTFWQVPDDSPSYAGKWALLPVWEGDNMMGERLGQMFQPPVFNTSSNPPVLVEIINATGNPDMAQLAADNLAWYGFVPVIGVDVDAPDAVTQLRYFAPNKKGIPYAWLVPWLFGQREGDIVLVDDRPDFPYNYQVVLGKDFDPCVKHEYAPQG